MLSLPPPHIGTHTKYIHRHSINGVILKKYVPVTNNKKNNKHFCSNKLSRLGLPPLPCPHSTQLPHPSPASPPRRVLCVCTGISTDTHVLCLFVRNNVPQCTHLSKEVPFGGPFHIRTHRLTSPVRILLSLLLAVFVPKPYHRFWDLVSPNNSLIRPFQKTRCVVPGE